MMASAGGCVFASSDGRLTLARASTVKPASSNGDVNGVDQFVVIGDENGGTHGGKHVSVSAGPAERGGERDENDP